MPCNINVICFIDQYIVKHHRHGHFDNRIILLKSIEMRAIFKKKDKRN